MGVDHRWKAKIRACARIQGANMSLTLNCSLTTVPIWRSLGSIIFSFPSGLVLHLKDPCLEMGSTDKMHKEWQAG